MPSNSNQDEARHQMQFDFEVSSDSDDGDALKAHSGNRINYEAEFIDVDRALRAWWMAIKNQVVPIEMKQSFIQLDGKQRCKALSRRVQTVKEQLKGGISGFYWYNDEAAINKQYPIYPVENYVATLNASEGYCLGVLSIIPKQNAEERGMLSEASTLVEGSEMEPKVIAIEDTDQGLSLSGITDSLLGSVPLLEGQLILVKGSFSSLNKCIRVEEIKPIPHPSIDRKTNEKENVYIRGSTKKKTTKHESDQSVVIQELMTMNIPIDCLFIEADIGTNEGIESLTRVLKPWNIKAAKYKQDGLWSSNDQSQHRLPPALVVIMGSLIPQELVTGVIRKEGAAAMSIMKQTKLLKAALTALTQILGELEELLKSAHIALVPGYPALGFPSTYPSMTFPEFLIDEMRSNLASKIGTAVKIHNVKNPSKIEVLGRNVTLSVVEHSIGMVPTIQGSRLDRNITNLEEVIPKEMLRQNSLIPEASVTRPHPGAMSICWASRTSFELADAEYPISGLPDLTIISDASLHSDVDKKKSWIFHTGVPVDTSKQDKLIVKVEKLHSKGSYIWWNAVNGDCRVMDADQGEPIDEE